MRKFWQKKYISKYTGKEIDDAVAKAGTALQNPMTAAGDLIVGGEDGAAGKLAKGTDGKVLKMVSGAPAWADDAGGMENPMTTAGDLIVGGESGAAGRLAKGTDGQVLSMVSGAPAWAAAQGGGHLYWHTVVFTGSSNKLSSACAIIIDTSSTNPSMADIKTLVNSGANVVLTSGYTNDTQAQPVLLRKYEQGPDNSVEIVSVASTGIISLANTLWSNLEIQAAYSTTNQIF